MSDQAPVNASVAAPANPASTVTPAAEPAPVTPPRRAEAPTAPSAKPKRLADKRRANPNFDAEAWARAGEKVKAREGGDVTPAPAKPGVPAKGPDGKFLPRSATAEAPAPAPAEAAPETPTPEPAPAEATPEAKPDRTTRLKQLEEIAAELGFKVDGKAVTTTDRYQLREEARRRQAAIDAKLQAERADIEKTKAAVETDGKRFRDFNVAFESGDPDAMAKAVGATDWNDLQEKVLARIADPHYSEIQKLRQQIEAREQAEREHAERATQAERQRQRQQIEAQAKQGIAAEAKASKNKMLSALSDDPAFVHTLFELQRRNYDPVTQTTCTLEDALDERLDNGTTLREYMQAMKRRLDAAFDELPPPRPVATPAAASTAPKPRVAAPPAPAPVETPAPGRSAREEKWRSRAERDEERIRRYAAQLGGGR